jgi:nitrogen regulation protein NR(I)
MSSLLVIDDEQSIRYSFQRAFEGDGLEVLTARTAGEGLNLVQSSKPDVVILDLQLPDRSGMEVFQDIHTLAPKTPVIFITAHGTTETALEAMKRGAFDYLVKPVDVNKLGLLIERALEAVRLMQIPAILPVDDEGDRIIGRSPIMQEMCKNIGRVASQDVNVLILGESGTGKELVARALYHHSNRADKPFLAINCAAIPENLLESELFGHEQGAFTGAVKRRIGKFEQVNGGTLFLDEIGDMAPALQSKMLRVLQNQQFERVGGNQTLQTQVRVLAATNQNLETLVEEGRFRKDLYYRLKVVTIRIPPLRQRSDDLAELAHYFLFRYNRVLGLEIRGFAAETLELLQAYPWPGNVRELQSVIKHAMLQGPGHIILPEFLPDHFLAATDSKTGVAPSPPGQEKIDSDWHTLFAKYLQTSPGSIHQRVIETVERELFLWMLRHTGGHQTQASELLGLNRATLRHKLRSLGLAIDKIITEGAGSQEEPIV